MSISEAEQNRRAVFRRDVELERLKKERNELLTRARTARAEAETAQRRLSELASMSKTFASSMRGVTVERQRGRRHLAVQYTVGRLLAESDGLEDAAPGILETIGTGFGWDLGVLWTVDEDAGVLRCDEFWRAPENGRSSVVANWYGFENASRRTSLPIGSGLPGRVWARGEALWIENVLEDEGFLRKEAADEEGLRKAFAFPLRDGSRTLGVIEFFGREAAPPDEDLLRVATLIGIQIGQFLERRRAEEALRKSEERYKTLYEDNPFMYFTVDKRGTVLSVNRFGIQDLGYTVEELVGHPVLDVFHEEDREGVSRYLRMCLQNLERPTSWEARKVRKNGSILWARENLRIVEGPEGDTIGLLICEDITERKQAEEQVLWQAQLLEQVQAAVISTDLQGTVTYWNEHAEELYGWSREEALGRNIMELIIGPEQAEVAEEIMERLSAGETWAGEFVVRRKDGSTFPAYVTDSLIYDAQGHAVGVVGVSTDTTERKKAEEERERLLAHEWRARAETEERKRIGRELHDRVAHSMGVVHQSLELYEVFKEGKPSQAESKMKLARDTTREALDLTRNISRELHNTEAGDGLSSALSNLLKTAVPPGLESSISVEGDESLIPPRVREQLFLILREAVRNVVSHSEAGQLGIEVRVSPERVVGRVEDDGRGLEGTTEDGDDNGASGRGLHSMRERAELVGGALTLSSAPGSGTRIEVSVPLSANGGGRR